MSVAASVTGAPSRPPAFPRRVLAGERMVELAGQAAELGFTDLGVTGLVAVELAPDPATKHLVGEPSERVEGAEQLAVLQHRLGQGVLAGVR
jgi:hypothetical protein